MKSCKWLINIAQNQKMHLISMLNQQLSTLMTQLVNIKTPNSNQSTMYKHRIVIWKIMDHTNEIREAYTANNWGIEERREEGHTGVDEEKGGVVDGDDGAGLPLDMVLALEEAQEGVADLGRRPLHRRRRGIEAGHGSGGGGAKPSGVWEERVRW